MIALLSTMLLAASMSHGEPMPGRVPELTPVTSAAQGAAGAELYATHCLNCHGTHMQGTAQGPSLRGVGSAAVDFMLSTGRMPLEVPGTEPMRGPPSYPRPQIDALIAYIGAHTSGGPAIPSLHAGGSLTRGRVVFEENCQSCHGATGDGAVAGFGWLAPSLHSATRLQLAEAVRTGPGIMPQYGPGVISDRDLDALAAYVDSLHHPDDRGGYSLASSGPTGEGLAAWVLGLSGAILIMLLVGETLRR